MSNYVDNVNILWWLNILKQEFAFNCKKQNVQIILTWQSVKKCYNSGSRTRIRPSFLFVNIFILYICITLLKDTSNKKVFYVMTLYCYGEKRLQIFWHSLLKKQISLINSFFVFFACIKCSMLLGCMWMSDYLIQVSHWRRKPFTAGHCCCVHSNTENVALTFWK